MRKLFLIILSVFCVNCFAQSPTLYIYNGQDLLVGRQSFTTISNASLAPSAYVYGHLINTNEAGYIAYQLPAQIFTGTNCVISLSQMTTNTNTFNYIVNVSAFSQTNGVIYTTTNNITSSLYGSASINFNYITITNSTWSTNYLVYRTNIAYGTLTIQHVSTNISGAGNLWFTGGKITFRN